MNWFTQRNIKGLSLADKQKYFNSTDFGGSCDHCAADHALAHVVSYENDSFGRESYIMCARCYNEAVKYEQSREVVCHDCHRTVLRGDCISWRWYDFYAAQGDEPLIVCKTCSVGQKHKDRVANDERERRADDEFCSRVNR